LGHDINLIGLELGVDNPLFLQTKISFKLSSDIELVNKKRTDIGCDRIQNHDLNDGLRQVAFQVKGFVVGCDVGCDYEEACVEELLENEFKIQDFDVFGHCVHSLPEGRVDEEVLEDKVGDCYDN
jgi:hypothetical protein